MPNWKPKITTTVRGKESDRWKRRKRRAEGVKKRFEKAVFCFSVTDEIVLTFRVNNAYKSFSHSVPRVSILARLYIVNAKNGTNLYVTIRPSSGERATRRLTRLKIAKNRTIRLRGFRTLIGDVSATRMAR